MKARHGKAQRREVAIGCHILNRMAELGRPEILRCGVLNEKLEKRPHSRRS